jgi:putative transposase
VFQRLTRGDPPHGDDVHPLSAISAAGRGSAIRARDRYLPRDGAVLVEPVRSDVCRGDPEAPGQSHLYSQWRWHLDEVFVRINGETYYLWRAVDHEGEVLEVFATKRRDRRAALKFIRRTMKRYGRPWNMVTDRLRSYGAAMKEIGNIERQECGRWLNNRAENSHQPFRRREGAMARFRDIKTLQKFASAHASIHNHFNKDRHLNRRDIFKQNRSAALAEWRQLAA